MDIEPKREVVPTGPSLMELSVTIAPFTHLEQIRLSKSSIESKSIDVSSDAQLKHSFDATTILNREAGTLSIRASLTVVAGDFVQIDADFVLDYSFDKSIPITDEVATAFGRINGIHNVWPYWREYVQSTSMRVGLPPIILPLMTGTSICDYYVEKDKVAINPHRKTHRTPINGQRAAPVLEPGSRSDRRPWAKAPFSTGLL